MKHTFFNTLLLIIFLSPHYTAFASNPDSTKSSIGIVVGYRGTNFNTPGLNLGIEKTYLQSEKYSVLGTAALQINRKPELYTSAGINFGSTLRRTGKRGLYLEHSLNIGYLGRYYDFDVYRTNSEGDIVNVGLKWNSTVTLGYSIGMGYDFSKKTNTNIQLFLKPGIYYDLLDRSTIYIENNYSIEIGLIFHPQGLNRNK